MTADRIAAAAAEADAERRILAAADLLDGAGTPWAEESAPRLRAHVAAVRAGTLPELIDCRRHDRHYCAALYFADHILAQAAASAPAVVTP